MVGIKEKNMSCAPWAKAIVATSDRLEGFILGGGQRGFGFKGINSAHTVYLFTIKDGGPPVDNERYYNRIMRLKKPPNLRCS